MWDLWWIKCTGTGFLRVLWFPLFVIFYQCCILIHSAISGDNLTNLLRRYIIIFKRRISVLIEEIRKRELEKQKLYPQCSDVCFAGDKDPGFLYGKFYVIHTVHVLIINTSTKLCA
jgi:hypothetical protein